MSKIPPHVLADAIKQVLNPTKPRKFHESVDLQVNLKNYDTTKDKRFSGSLKLPNVARPNMKVCIICDQHHLDLAAKDKLLTQTMDDLKKLNKNKKLVKKLCSQYDAFLASETIIKTIPRVVGPHMNRAGKFPSSVSQADSLKEKVIEQQSTVKFQLKKVLCLGTCVGHVKMTDEELRQNTALAINFLVSLLKKNWQNLKSAYIKSTMGESQRIY
jgi:large subunit ribosomal protein L10Ae